MSNRNDHNISIDLQLRVQVKFSNEVWQGTQSEQWKDAMYDLANPGELAKMFAYNAVLNGVEDMTRLDGFAHLDPHQISVCVNTVLMEQTDCKED